MTAISALHSDLRGPNLGSARIGNDTRDYNELADQIALQLSEHSGIFIAVELNLEQRKFLSRIAFMAEIVSFVHLLNSFLELEDVNQ
jgi:hypothetical protein